MEAALGERIITQPGRASGFSITKGPGGTIEFGWNSGQINPGSHGGGRAVPEGLREEIIDFVYFALGL
jgi:hypothetical protein